MIGILARIRDHRHARRGSTRQRPMLVRIAAATATIGLVASSGACGFEPSRKTAPPPADDTAIRGDGINVDVGSGSDKVMVRDLMIVSRHQGRGVLSASIDAASDDSLEKVSGNVITGAGKKGKPLKVAMSPISVGGSLVVLADEKPIRLRSSDLETGLAAQVKLSFEHAGNTQVEVPIADGEKDRRTAPKAAD